ncbi:adenylyltransferase/cytidyltransferase family protein [Parasphingorhabdus flavimaris]|uniref:Adenylyltransferase/cytidyltransferase family protein n=1 Tax=Parasphingorhabdus flavimaris TaxID=266812 RepID=A0ABX2N4F8_9SPHN|nr:adenylyltransferase/cytidyltransferase family protein [Parasphingorhabdus flavimaris]
MDKIKIGSVHGRFQPFHNGHLDYVLQAFARADHIFIGITQIIRPTSRNDDKKRETSDANPFSFFDRRALLIEGLLENDIPRDRFSFIPFPIEKPKQISEFFPRLGVCYTTVVDEWNREKIKRLNLQGYKVVELDVSPADNIRVTSGTEIRRMIRAGDNQWKRFVPVSVAEKISREMLPEILSV